MTRNEKRYAVIMAGGCGERLWPLSTPEHPKQFLKIFGGTSLIRQALERVLPLVPVENVFVVTARNLARATFAELPEVARENVLLEPCRKNTGPAVAAALGEIRRRAGERALVAVVTADQLMTKPAVFRRLLNRAFSLAARKDAVVTLGVKPTYAATGYGYINAVRRKFVEKPDAVTAARYVRSGNFVWNAGMFIFRTGALQDILVRVAPELATLSECLRTAKCVSTRMSRIYPKLTSISFDYAVMEKIREIEVIAGDFGWDDVGGYASMISHFSADADGNHLLGASRQLECKGCAVIGDGARISAFGVRDLVIASCGKEVLVMSKARAAELKRLL